MGFTPEPPATATTPRPIFDDKKPSKTIKNPSGDNFFNCFLAFFESARRFFQDFWPVLKKSQKAFFDGFGRILGIAKSGEHGRRNTILASPLVWPTRPLVWEAA